MGHFLVDKNLKGWDVLALSLYGKLHIQKGSRIPL